MRSGPHSQAVSVAAQRVKPRYWDHTCFLSASLALLVTAACAGYALNVVDNAREARIEYVLRREMLTADVTAEYLDRQWIGATHILRTYAAQPDTSRPQEAWARRLVALLSPRSAALPGMIAYAVIVPSVTLYTGRSPLGNALIALPAGQTPENRGEPCSVDLETRPAPASVRQSPNRMSSNKEFGSASVARDTAVRGSGVAWRPSSRERAR